MYVRLAFVMRAGLMVAGVVVGGYRKLTVFISGVIMARRWFKTLRERSILHLLRHTKAYIRHTKAWPRSLACIDFWQQFIILKKGDNK